MTSEGAAGNDLATLAFVDIGKHPCYLRGRPTVRLLTSTGRVLPHSSGASFFPDDGPIIVVLKPGIQLPKVDGQWSSGQGQLGIQAVDCNPKDKVVRALIDLPTGRLTVQVPPDRITSIGPACPNVGNGGGVEESIEVNNFQYPPPDQSGPSLYTSVAVNIDASGPVTSGARFRYLVTLTNLSFNELWFPGCPTYRQDLSWSGSLTGRALRLNCPSGSIPANGSLTFEMLIDVPSDARGEGTLRWWLDPFHGGPKVATMIQIGQQA